MGKAIELQHNSPEWYAARFGKITSSQGSKILSSTGSISKSQDKYAKEIIGERDLDPNYLDQYIARAQRSFQSADMKAGHIFEPVALHEYEKEVFDLCTTDLFFEESEGLPLYGWLAGSPDFLRAKAKILGEIKSRIPAIHKEFARKKMVPAANKPQCWINMYLAEEAEVLHYVSFCPYVRKNKLVIVEVARDQQYEDYIGGFLAAAKNFIDIKVKPYI